jgi:hypothetical protein
MQAVVMIHRMVEEGVLFLRCHAGCCCDPQNALVKEGVLRLRPCKLAAADPQNALGAR